MELDTRDTCTAAIRMFKDMNMIKKFRIPYEVSTTGISQRHVKLMKQVQLTTYCRFMTHIDGAVMKRTL